MDSFRQEESLETVIIGAIKARFTDEASAIFEEKKRELVDELELRKNEIVSGMAIEMMKFVQIETLVNQVVVTIKKQ